MKKLITALIGIAGFGLLVAPLIQNKRKKEQEDEIVDPPDPPAGTKLLHSDKTPLGVGSRGKYVLYAQARLNYLSMSRPLVMDGIYGNKTHAEFVKRWYNQTPDNPLYANAKITTAIFNKLGEMVREWEKLHHESYAVWLRKQSTYFLNRKKYA